VFFIFKAGFLVQNLKFIVLMQKWPVHTVFSAILINLPIVICAVKFWFLLKVQHSTRLE